MHPFDRNPPHHQMVVAAGGRWGTPKNAGGAMKITPGLIWIGWITLATLVFYLGVAMHTAVQRGRHRIMAPATTGHPAYELAARIHANTLEYLVPFLVALWMCAVFFEPLPAAILGIVWLFGRVIYVFGYWSAPPRRQPGFILALFALILLVILTGYGLFRMGLVMGV
jgi:glutathione S-transferase